MIEAWLQNINLSVTWQGYIGGREFFCRECVTIAGLHKGNIISLTENDITYENKGYDACTNGRTCPVCSKHIIEGIEVVFTVL